MIDLRSLLVRMLPGATMAWYILCKQVVRLVVQYMYCAVLQLVEVMHSAHCCCLAEVLCALSPLILVL